MAQTDSATQTTEIPRLKARYREEIVPALRSEFEIANIMQVPELCKTEDKDENFTKRYNLIPILIPLSIVKIK